MNLTDALIPPGWNGLWWPFLALLGVVLWRAPWVMLRKPGVLNLMLGASVLVLAYWQIHAGLRPGLGMHLLGATLLTLLFGPWFGFLIVLVALVLNTAWFGGAWYALPLNAWVMGVVPVTVSWALYRLVEAKLPNHLFIYIFINAFLGAGLAVMATGLMAVGVLTAMGDYSWLDLSHNYLPYYFLMAWSEAVTTGMLITVLVVYKPQWVATFNDKQYLDQ
ncbi:MAG: energy-coupling factor ABC transporter permease [Betaproteobacteria bacterium]|nr:energy-coupling factor ABC transporter permease [Betaproteobacteria bacterium]